MTAIAGGLPDVVPAYTPTVACDVAGKILGRPVNTGSPSLWYAEAKALLTGSAAHAEFEAKLEEDLLDLDRALKQDVFRYGWRKTVKPTAQLDENTFLYGDPDGLHEIWRWDPDARNFLKISDTAPRRRVEDWPAIARSRQQDLESTIEHVRANLGIREAELQARLGEEMLVTLSAGALSLGTDETSLMATALEPGAVADIMDCQLEVAVAQMETLAERGLKVVMGGGDMADKNGPIYSPQTFRDLLLPRLKKLITRCRELGLHYVWRTDGKIWPIADMIFVEAAVPGYGEIDYEVTMTAGKVRKKYPGLVLWPNVSGDRLRRRSRDEVYAHCMEILEATEGRRYFHGCSNTILPGTPPENVWAMMEARDDY